MSAEFSHPTDGGLPLVELQPYAEVQGRVVDPVDPVAAAMVDAADARTLRILPYAIGVTSLYVAVAEPSEATAEFLAQLGGSVHMLRAQPEDLAFAQDRAYGDKRDLGQRWGALAIGHGLVTEDDVAAALQTQAVRGGRLGEILAANNRLTFEGVAQTLAHQVQMPRVDLVRRLKSRDAESPRIDLQLFDSMPESFWRGHRAVPVLRWRQVLVVAVEDPTDAELEPALTAALQVRVRRVVTGRRDIEQALETKYERTYLAASRDGLRRLRPSDSALRLLSGGQTLVLLAGSLAVLGALISHPVGTLTYLNTLAILASVLMVIWRLWLIRPSTAAILEVDVTEADIAMLDETALPAYTILVPLRDEVEVLPILARALAEIDYPKDRLDVKLLIERDDVETLRAARQGRLPSYMEVVMVPPSQPRTKPKACNYGLYHARGEYVVVYDAEDIPEPDQLKKAFVAFTRAGHDVACLQAKLSYYNSQQNILTRWFTAEYAMWFEGLLPALHASKLPIPLGGTSNHIRVDVLRQVGGWDAHNVTEDADLGIRLHKAGHRTAIIDSTTYEEANSDFVNWMRQRSRWVKGYIQTWLVNMRHPVALWRQLGPRGFVGFQMMVGGTPLTFLLNPLYWLLTTLWFLGGWQLVPRVFPTWVYYLGMGNMLFGAFAFTYMNMAAVARRGQWDLMRYTVLAPMYWSLMSVASWKAVVQLFTRRSHWEKTQHGLSDLSPLLESPNGPEPLAQSSPRVVNL